MSAGRDAAKRQELPWNEKTAPDRVRPRECVRAAFDNSQEAEVAA